MTEREKAAAGLLYDANYDEELIREREACKDLCFRLNSCLPSDTRSQKEILKKLIPGIPDSAVVTAPFWCDYGRNITVGKAFIPITTVSSLTGQRLPSAIMYLSPPTAASPPPAIRWTPNSGTKAWKSPFPSPWGTMSGSEPMSPFFPASPSVTTP